MQAAHIAGESNEGRWVRLDLFGGYRSVPRQRYEYGLLTLLTVFAAGCSVIRCAPNRFRSAFRHPRISVHIPRRFGCPCFSMLNPTGFFITEKGIFRRAATAIPNWRTCMIGWRVSRSASWKVHRQPVGGRRPIIAALQDGSPRRSQIART